MTASKTVHPAKYSAEMISYRRALFVSALPYRREIYRKTSWSFLETESESTLFQNLRLFYSARTLDEAKKRTDHFLEKQSEPIPFACIQDASYPPLLKEIYDPPPVLFYRGKLPLQKNISIVGTRNAAKVTEAGIHALLEKISEEIPDACIVSGFARGTDFAAHREALFFGLHTAAVLASGILRPSPKSSLPLLHDPERITLISEFFPDEVPVRRHFVRRNRIIAGLSSRVIVMQAPEKSGALITASYAFDEGRDVLVFYHDLLKGIGFHEGGLELIRQGADVLRLDRAMKFSLRSELSAGNLWDLKKTGRYLDSEGQFCFYKEEKRK